MSFFLLKIIISGVLVAVVSTLGRKYPVWGGVLAAMPIISLLALGFLNYETGGDREQVARLSVSIGTFVLPTVGFLFLFPALYRKGLSLAFALTLSLSAMILVDVLLILWLRPSR